MRVILTEMAETITQHYLTAEIILHNGMCFYQPAQSFLKKYGKLMLNIMYLVPEARLWQETLMETVWTIPL